MTLNPIVAEINPVTPHKYSYDPENSTNGGSNANTKAPPYKIPMSSRSEEHTSELQSQA